MKLARNKKEAGFTLIELLIVIAIIGILAAIAIPQFAKYRTRAYNSAALSDLRNLQQTEAAFYADWQTYGSTYSGSTANATLTGPLSNARLSDGSNNSTIGVSKNVSICAAGSSTNYAAEAKHKNGDKVYAGDSQDSGVFYKSGTAGKTLGATAAAIGFGSSTQFSSNSTWQSL